MAKTIPPGNASVIKSLRHFRQGLNQCLIEFPLPMVMEIQSKELGHILLFYLLHFIQRASQHLPHFQTGALLLAGQQSFLCPFFLQAVKIYLII